MIVAAAWAAAVVAVVAFAGVRYVIDGQFESDVILLVTAAVAYSSLGLLVVARQPGNRVAWLLFVVATWVAISGLSTLRAVSEDVKPVTTDTWDVLVIMWGNVGYFIGLLLPLLIFLYVFPTGRFLTRRWSWVGWAFGVVSVVVVASQVLAKQVGPDTADWTVENPFGIIGGAPLSEGLLGAIFGIGFMGLAAGAILAITLRFRRADPTERAQIKWVFLAMIVMVASTVVNAVFDTGLPSWIATVLFGVLLLAVPVSVTIAITRYQLYEIDRLISRTVGYLLLWAALGLVYVFGAIWLPTWILGARPPAFVAGSTLVTAALFSPVRRFLLDRVDRRFNRARYDSRQTLERFAAEMSQANSVDHLEAKILNVIDRTMRPESAAIWLAGGADAAVADG